MNAFMPCEFSLTHIIQEVSAACHFCFRERYSMVKKKPLLYSILSNMMNWKHHQFVCELAAPFTSLL